MSTDAQLARALADITDEGTYEATVKAAADLRAKKPGKGSVAHVMATRREAREAAERRSQAAQTR